MASIGCGSSQPAYANYTAVCYLNGERIFAKWVNNTIHFYNYISIPANGTSSFAYASIRSQLNFSPEALK